MPALLSLAKAQPERNLEPGEVLVEQGSPGGDLYILESGRLDIGRDGIAVTTLDQPGSLIGEMSVLLGVPSSATVRASGYARVRVIAGARELLREDAELTFELAALVAARLNSTTALLVSLAREHPGESERSLLGRILSAIHLPGTDPDDPTPSPWGMVGPTGM
ncbi:MAG TPA: cyclic nucleotide-binding domain-containing protein [Devosia sp.]|nr:cyclic nucleotide-binding domain-containing protein [Devosia sp.]